MKKLLSMVIVMVMLIAGVSGCAGEVAAYGPAAAGQADNSVSSPAVRPMLSEDGGAAFTVEAVSMEQAGILTEGSSIKSLVRLPSGLALLWEGDKGWGLGMAEYCLSGDGRPCIEAVEETEFVPPFENTVCYGLAAAGDEGFALLAGNSRDGAADTLSAQLYDAAGRLIDSMEISGWAQMTVDSFCVSGNGELVLAAGGTVLVYARGEARGREPDTGLSYVCNVSRTADGVIILGRRAGEQNNIFLLLDDESGVRQLDLYSLVGKEDMELRSALGESYRSPPCQGLEGEYILNTGAVICRADPEQGLGQPLLWNTAYDPAQVFGQSCLLGPKSLACIVDGKLMLAWEHTVEKRESGIVRLGIVEINAYGSIARSLAGAGGADSPYTLQSSTYSNDEAGIAKFQADLAGGAFDLVIFHDEINTFNSSFDDLYPYLDADTELTRSSFIPGLLESSSVQGQLKQLWNSALVHTMLGPAALLEEESGLTLTRCREIADSSSRVQSVLDNRFGDETQLRYDSLQNLSYLAVAAFVDRDTGTCSFDSPEFEELLRLCGELRANPDSSGNDFLLYECSGGNAGFMEQTEAKAGPCTAVGWPDGGDGIHYYSLPYDYTNCYTVAIPSNSSNKAAAWGVIKFILSPGRQWDIASNFARGMPVLYEVMEDYNRQNYSEEQYRAFLSLLERTGSAVAYRDETLRLIIMDEGRAYLAGDKSAAEAARQIQSRISIYMAEQYT